MQCRHVAVACDLGQDRGGHDGRLDRIAADDGARGAAQCRRHAVAVDQRAVRGRRQRRQRAAHAFHRRPQDVERVDFLALDEHDAPGERALEDDRFEPLALLDAQGFRIAKPTDAPAGIQDHRRDRHRAGQRPAARLVDTGDAFARRGLVAAMPVFDAHGARPSSRAMASAAASEAPPAGPRRRRWIAR